MCAPGLQSLHYTPFDLEDPNHRIVATWAEERDVNKRHLLMHMLPQLTGLLPRGAEIQLDMRWGEPSLHQTDRLSDTACHHNVLACWRKMSALGSSRAQAQQNVCSRAMGSRR